MEITVDSIPDFNLWTEPWITLERPDGTTERRGIAQTLLHAHEYQSLYASSPLVIVGIHRLLMAILQAAFDPRKMADLRALWKARRFAESPIQTFEQQYADRFGLFSADKPFMQSADLPLQPEKGGNPKSVSYLAMELPTRTEVTHFRHRGDADQAFCSACAAGGLVIVPAFATSGGSSFRPSINGIPPIYVLPGGSSLFESLTASLILPDYQPEVASREQDEAWWTRPALVERSKEMHEVGYLHSLTFPARRVRLHPEPIRTACTWCGQFTEWGVRTMVFEMGECRPRGAAFWFDPFAAYRSPREGSNKPPVPIRPVAGRALWREFVGLFLQGPSAAESTSGKKRRTQRPRVLNQIAALKIGEDLYTYPFRCIGMRTDKAKVFEWIDVGFDVPASMLADETVGVVVDDAIGFATNCDTDIKSVFHSSLGGNKKQEHFRNLKIRMGDEFWTALAEPFRQFALGLADVPVEERAEEMCRWVDVVVREAQDAFCRAAAAVGDDAVSLRQRVQGERRCRGRLHSLKQKICPSRKEDR